VPVADLTIQGKGILVDVSVGASAAMRSLLWRKNVQVPPAVLATLLIDTGANTSMISEQLMRSLGIAVRGKR